MFRRNCLAMALMSVCGTMVHAAEKVGIKPETVPGRADYPELRAGTQLDHLYESMLANGFGISNPNIGKDKPVVVIVSDTQCPWCSKLWNAAKPLQNQVNFIWFPIPVLRDLSIDQAALILSSEEPWDAMQHHEDHFKDKDFRVINPVGTTVDKKYRDEVWTNAKIARWSGLTTVPLGVFKNSSGKYIPIPSGTDTEHIKKIVGIEKDVKELQ